MGGLEELYSEDHRIFRASFRRFVAREITPRVRQWETEGGIPRDLWRAMGREGFLCPWMPEAYGGLGLGYEFSVIIGEELVRGDAFGTGIPLHSDVVTPYIHRFGSEKIKHTWLPACLKGEAVTAIGLTEPEAGSDLAAIRTHGVREENEYVIDGQKTFITNGHSADLVVLAVKTDAQAGFWGTSLILVETNRPGFSRGRPLEKMGCRLQDTAQLFFDQCRVPTDNLLGEEGLGYKYLMERLPEERLEVAVKCQAMAEEIFKETVSYAKNRRAFGQPIGHFQHNAFKLAEMATDVELGRTFLDRLVLDHVQGLNIASRSAMAKFWLSEMVNRLADQAVQLHGGYGYMEEYRICRMYRDVRVTTLYAGTNEIMKHLISRHLGFKDRGASGPA